MNRLELLETLSPLLPGVTAVIGGGGKTTLLFALGEYLAGRGRRVLLTTTTHMGWQEDVCAPGCVRELDECLIPGRAVLAGYPDGRGKLTGIPPAWYGQVSADNILVEADGSRGLPLKYHRPHEPVVPEGARLLIQLAGLSALDRPARGALHGWKEAGFSSQRRVDEELMADLLLRGFEASGAVGKRIVILNQADTPALARRGETVTELLSGQGISVYVTRLKEDVPCVF